MVVHDAGFHAFVPHASNGITMKGTISHDTYSDAYWWDPGATNASHDITWDTAVASKVKALRDSQYRYGGFALGAGNNNSNTLKNSVAVGVQGAAGGDAAGFLWPEIANGTDAVWNFDTNNIAHNNKNDGIFTWQNNSDRHIVANYSVYHNSDNGVEHGAYSNEYLYINGAHYGNGNAEFMLHATSGSNNALELNNLTLDSANISAYGLQVVKHTLAGGQRTVVKDSTFQNATDSAIGFTYGGDPSNTTPEIYMFANNTIQSGLNEFSLSDNITADSLITVEEPSGDLYELRRYDQSGTYVSAWNASKTDLTDWSAPTYSGFSTSDDFTGADGDPWGSQWTVTATGSATTSIYSNEARVVGSGAVTSVLNDTNANNVNSQQQVQLRGNTTSTGMQGGLIARRSDSDSDTFYKAVLNSHYQSGQTLLIVRQVDGVGTVIWVGGVAGLVDQHGLPDDLPGRAAQLVHHRSAREDMGGWHHRAGRMDADCGGYRGGATKRRRPRGHLRQCAHQFGAQMVL